MLMERYVVDRTAKACSRHCHPCHRGSAASRCRSLLIISTKHPVYHLHQKTLHIPRQVTLYIPSPLTYSAEVNAHSVFKKCISLR